MHELVHANASFLAAWVFTSIGVVAIALLVERKMKASAATRHVLIFAAMLAPPVLAPLALLDLPAPNVGRASARPAIEIGRAEARPTLSSVDIACAVMALWSAGTLLAVLRTARDAQRWRNARKRATPVSDRAMPVDHPVEISDACREPAVAGILDPTILLPAGPYLDALSDDELETVLAHEIEHVRRRDNLRAFIVQLVCTFFWFSPVHRAARRRLVELRERACDDAVLARGCRPDSYLSALAKSCQSSLQSTAVSCMSRLQLRERMESIMTFESQSPRGTSWAARIGIVAVAGLIVTAFALFAPSPSLHASSATPGPFSADVWVKPAPDGRWLATVKLDAPDGPFTSVAVMPSIPDDRTITSTHGGRTYKVTMHTNSDASGSADVEVREGDAIVWSAVRTFSAPPAPKSKYAPVGEGMTPPKLLSSVDPKYTEEAKKNGIYGIVIVQAMINERGTVDAVQVLKPLPYGLDQTAADAIRQWRFAPATVNGEPVPVSLNLTINFRLDD
ncbi:MAG TPA: M56 family metallopeptidase [Thermoanaerobaculia bacterium]|nr:M56 family metallopeptidase [Thermoanaerobaculia bacterium]